MKKKKIRTTALITAVFLFTGALFSGCGSPALSGAASPGSASAEGADAADRTAGEETGAEAGAASAAGASEAAGADPSSDSSSDSSSEPAGEGSSSGRPRLLDYIDAWDEWHTMEVDPSVRENPYDPSAFVFGQGDPQWVSYQGMSNDSAGADDAGERTAEDAGGRRQLECLQGIDVSEHQGDIDWEAVAEAGYRFAFVRVGYRGYGEEGKLCEDVKAVENLQKAKAAGLEVGAYFFSQALNEEEAGQEAQLAAEVLERAGVGLDLPLMYDPEIIKDDWGRANGIKREQVALNTEAFRERAQGLCDCAVDIYSNLPWEHHYFDAETMNRYEIWYADYEKLPQTPYHFTWWQYSNQGNVPGISGSVDLNIWIR